MEYPSATDAGARRPRVPAGANSTGEISGRIALLVCAHYAREECVAHSNRAAYALRPGGYAYGPARGLPWTGQVLAEVEAIARERLPEHLTAHVREARGRPRRELGRYTAGGQQRILVGQRIDGQPCLIDMPAGDHGRVHLVERGLTSHAELQAIVADYIQSERRASSPSSRAPATTCSGQKRRHRSSCTTWRSRWLIASLAGLGRLARSKARAWALVAR